MFLGLQFNNELTRGFGNKVKAVHAARHLSVEIWRRR